MRHEAAIRRIESFGKRFGPSRSHLYLAYHAAFPLALTPDLLYRIWANFQRDVDRKLLNIPWIAVADLLLSNLCDDVGHELYEMDVAVRNELLKQLKEDSRFGEKRINDLSNFLLAYVRKDLNSSESDQRDFAQSQRWTALAYKDSEEAARELALAFNQAYNQDRAELVRLATLTETLAQPLQECEKLLIYARAMGHYARNRLEEAKNQVTHLPRKGRLVSISEVILAIPLELIVDTEAIQEQTPAPISSQLNLIQSLLAAPVGQESIILQANQHLINESLLITIKQVVAIMADEGNDNVANFLRDMAAQLAEFVVESSPIEFLSEVLQATLDSNGNPQTVYPILSANLDKLDNNFSGFLQAWATDILPSLDPEQARGVAKTIADFSNLIGQFPLGSRANNIEIAIAGYETSLIVFYREDYPELWANIQNNLGTVYSNRIRGEKAENLERAIACYYQGLEVTTREAFPEEWARTQNNLGTAYSDRIRGERAENLEMAIGSYFAALEVYTRNTFPENWATTENNLATAFSNRIRGERAENIERAIASYMATLEVYTRMDFPEQWAMTQNNLANAYSHRIRGDRADNIEYAIASYMATLEVYTRMDFPEQWAMTQNNLANAYSHRITGNRAENIDRAIAHYQMVLEIYTRADFPETWATCQNNLATAYSNRIRGDRADNIEYAIASYQAALEVYTRDDFPEKWASVQNNVGSAYSNRFRGNRGENIDRAIACYLQASEVYNRADFPEQWAMTQINLGLAYKNIGNIDEAYNTLISAIETVELLHSEITSGYETKQKHAEKWNELYNTLVEVCLEIGSSAKAIEYVERSKARNFSELLIARNFKSLDSIVNQEKYIKYSEIEALLDNKTTIVEWYFLGNKFITFIINHNTPSPIVWQSSASDLEALQDWSNEYLSTYYQRTKQWSEQLQPRLVRLAEILHIDEILLHIPETCSQIVLIPHRYLHNFPLHALPIAVKGQEFYLIDRFPDGVQYAPNCQMIQLLQNREHPNFNHLFAIQNPTDDLAFCDLEVETIKPYFNQTTILSNQTATKAALNDALEELQSAHCFHFSGHSKFDFTSPLDSVLVLADARRTSAFQSSDNLRAPFSIDSGQSAVLIDSRENAVLDEEKCLKLSEIYNLNLSQCRLVTLSACETSLIDFSSTSDEYIGFPGAFLCAGATNVVGSLWSLNDISTAFLLIKFYDNLLQGVSVAVALNQAQLWLKNSTVEELLEWVNQVKNFDAEISRQLLRGFHKNEKPFANPFYWAAFTVVGKLEKSVVRLT